MNSVVERFGFGLSIFLAFVYPVLLVLVLVLIGLLGQGSDAAEALVTAVILFNALAYAIVFPVLFIILSIWIESIHFKSLEQAEQELSDMTWSDMKTLPPNWKAGQTFFVCENVVVANDYLKRLFWTFRKIVGGRSESYTKLIERARREAVVRLLRTAREGGANVVWNVRLETTVIQLNTQGENGKMAGVEVMAYGTAFSVTSR